MSKLEDEIKAQIEALQLNPDLAAMLLSRLQYYIDSANQFLNNAVFRNTGLATRRHIPLFNKLISTITPLLKKNVSDVRDKGDKKSDKKEEEKQDMDVALKTLLSALAAIPALNINPKGLLAAILGAFLTLYPQYRRFFSFEIQNRLPVTEEWLNDPAIRNKYIKMRDGITSETSRTPRKILFSALIEYDHYVLINTYLEDLTKLSNDDWNVRLGYLIEDIFPYLEKYLARTIVDTLITLTEKSTTRKLEGLITILDTIYDHIKHTDKRDAVFKIFRKLLYSNYPQAVDAAVEAMANATTGLRDSYEGIQQDFTFCIRQFSLNNRSVKKLYAVQLAGNLYQYANDQNSLKDCFNSLMDIIKTRDNDSTSLITKAYQALAMAYSKLSKESQKDFFIRVTKLPDDLTKYNTFATMLEYIHLDNYRSEFEPDSVNTIITALLADVKLYKYLQDITALLKIFYYINNNEQCARIFEAMMDILQERSPDPFFHDTTYAMLTKMTPHLSDQNRSAIIFQLLPVCQIAISPFPYLLLAALLPITRNISERDAILKSLQQYLKTATDRNFIIFKHEKIIASLPWTEQTNLTDRIIKKIKDSKPDSQCPSNLFFHIMHNQRLKQCDKEVKTMEENLKSILPPPVTKIIKNYLT